ncbi:MAG: hypothetical protein ACFFDW_06705 [Candidatus Thorarchaeota archaeon]
MKNKIRISILLLLIVNIICIFSNSFIQAEAVSYPINVKNGDTLRWNFDYNGTYSIGFSTTEWMEAEIITKSSNSVTLNFTDDIGTNKEEICYPIDTLQYLPIGSDSSFSTIPDLADIVGPLAVISTNWKEQYDYWTPEDNILSVNNRWAIHHLRYPFLGAWRDVYIFNGTVSQYHFGQDLIGEFFVIYTADTGILLELFLDLNVGYITQNMKFHLVLEESSIGLTPSTYLVWLIISSIFFGSQGIIILVLLTSIVVKRRIDIAKLVEEEKPKEVIEKELEEEEKPKIEFIPPPDYNFIYNCPYCNAQMTDKDEVCPQCGGKK